MSTNFAAWVRGDGGKGRRVTQQTPGETEAPSEAREVVPTQVLEGAWRQPPPPSGQEAVWFCLGLPDAQAPEVPPAQLP